MLRLQNVTKRFEEKTALDGVTLEIAAGEFLVLVGPSGCGKSTLLRLLAGLEHPSHGEIWLDEVNITAASPRQRNFAMIFQNYALFPHLSVKDNITFGMRVRREPKAGWSARVAQVARMLELDDLLERKPAKLSGGQRQRVAMARAIVRDPRLFLMDEPLSNLDARLRGDVRDSIMALHRQLRTATVYVTHDQIEAMSMADRIVVLDQGRVQQIGPPEYVYARPANVFVAGFIGSPGMNLLTLPCERGAIALGAQSYLLPAPAQQRDSVIVGIRPEHITDDLQGTRQLLCLPATVTQRELMGADYLLHISTPIGALRYCRKNRGDAPRLGDSLSIGFSPIDIHLFDAQTQRALYQETPHASASDTALTGAHLYHLAHALRQRAGEGEHRLHVSGPG
ncbi:Putative sugar ABC transporter ATP-binding protein [Sodalis praecaptivus]|uniref:Putative sugar ABC transporter ATP-binding protein n=1 Tax=Sodalis praecaptivus TaxID=1239307 RepID=W0HU60_9GAMM|nr:Putative sugar ABC transporter ATP-binding protein [Sodalis praecaptivus]